jgi:hypothetical protein
LVPNLGQSRQSDFTTKLTRDTDLTNREGVVIRRENAEILEARAKLVRPDIAQVIGEHWRNRPIEWNAITMF